MRCQEPHFGVARRKLFASVVNGGHYEYTKGAAMLESSLGCAKALACESFALLRMLHLPCLPFPPHTHSLHLSGTHTLVVLLALARLQGMLCLLSCSFCTLSGSSSARSRSCSRSRLTLALLLLLQRIANALWTSPISVDPPLLLLAFVLCRPLPLPSATFSFAVVPYDCLACCSTAIGLCCAASTYGSILYVTDSLHFS